MITAKTLLVTGFEPFGGDTDNPSWDVAQALHGRRMLGHRLVARRLCVEFGRAAEQLRAALDQLQPALVLCIGQAGGRSAIGFERVAINIDDARITDNAGAQPIDRAISVGAPAAYFASLPIKAMREACLARGLPAEVSNTAGTFVCNHVFYALMHALSARPGVRGGFVHIPYSPAQASRHPGAPSMAPELVIEGLRAALRVALIRELDLEISAGRLH